MTRTEWRVLLVLAVLGVGAVSMSAVPLRATAVEDPLAKRFGGPFTLVGPEGRAVRDTDFRGRFMLIFFGFTHCPDICPTGLAVMTAALDQLGMGAYAIQPIFITVDPARDRPDVLAAYVKSFHPRLMGLTGTEAEIAAVAKAYRVHRRKYIHAAGRSDYGVDHGSLMYLMGPDGQFRTLIPHGTLPEKMAETLARYLPR